MPERIRWCLMEPMDRSRFDRLFGSLVRDEYADAKQWGFSNVSKQGTKIDAQYIERTEKVLQIEDPFGKILEFPQIYYEKWLFSLSIKPPHVELHDSPRSPAALLHQLAQYLNFEIGVGSIQVDPLTWANRLSDTANAVTVSALVLSDIALTTQTQAKINIVGSEDVRRLIKTLTGERSYSVTRAQIKGVHRGHPFRVELFRDAHVNILSAGTSIVQLLRKALWSAVESSAR